MAILNNNPLVGASGNQGGYNINNSLRFRQSATAHLTRTPASTTNQKTWTWSGWIKRGLLNAENKIFGAGTSGSNVWYLMFGDGGSGDTLAFGYWNGSTHPTWLITTQVFRDPSAWYHIVLAVDTTQATSSNRIKLYINGNQVTVFGTATYPSQNTDTLINSSGATQYIGNATSPVTTCYDGYMADINFIDGSAKTPSDFGETDTTTGVWKPKAYTGTYGTNGFYLKFSDIATTSGSNAGLGKDFSGNSNYWTTNNISVTSGTTYDAMTDSPTLTSATVANYCTLNPLLSSTTITFSAANLNATVGASGSYRTAGGTIAVSSGKWYFEALATTPFVNSDIGVGDVTQSKSTWESDTTTSANFWYLNPINGNKVNGNGAGTSYGSALSNGDIIMCAIDMDNGKIWWGVNGTWIASGSPSAGTNAAFTNLSGFTLTPAFMGGSGSSGGSTQIANFGQRPFSYTPPTGYVALNTYNLPTPTILQGNKYMDAQLWTGDGVNNRVISQYSFYPDFTWIKTRSSAYWHVLADSVRGANQALFSNSTSAESTNDTNGYTSAFSSTGFTLTSGATSINDVNQNGQTYVGWCWNAGANSTSSNTSGSITSTVSVNTTAGFSIVTYTGAGTSAGTVGHGLGVAPKLIIAKTRTSAQSWVVYHETLGINQLLELNTTGAASTISNYWGSSAPTSTVFGVYTANNIGNNNYLNIPIVAYCFAEIAGYSKFGSYTGNGSTDGPFVYFGFRPKYFLIKRSDAGTTNWVITDGTRNIYNQVNLSLAAQTSSAEESSYAYEDFLANGVKIRTTDASLNASGATYIYAAFAENPFKNSLAR